MMRDFATQSGPFILAVIAGLTRNLPNDVDSSSRLGDSGCFSAMTGKGIIVG